MSFTSFFAAAINKGAKLTKGPAEVAAHFDGLVAAAKVGRALDPAALDAARTAYRNLLESLPKGSARSEAERDFATEVVQAVGKELDKKDAFMKALGADGIADSVLNAEAKAAKKAAGAADKVSQTLSGLNPKATKVEDLDASLRTLRTDLGKAGLIDANAASKPRTVKDIRGALESGQAITQAEFTKFASGLRQESLVAERGRLVTQIERATTTPDGRADAALFDRLETLRADKDYPKGKGASTNDALADLKAGRPVSDDSLTALRNHHTRPVDPPAPPPRLTPAQTLASIQELDTLARNKKSVPVEGLSERFSALEESLMQQGRIDLDAPRSRAAPAEVMANIERGDTVSKRDFEAVRIHFSHHHSPETVRAQQAAGSTASYGAPGERMGTTVLREVGQGVREALGSGKKIEHVKDYFGDGYGAVRSQYETFFQRHKWSSILIPGLLVGGVYSVASETASDPNDDLLGIGGRVEYNLGKLAAITPGVGEGFIDRVDASTSKDPVTLALQANFRTVRKNVVEAGAKLTEQQGETETKERERQQKAAERASIDNAESVALEVSGKKAPAPSSSTPAKVDISALFNTLTADDELGLKGQEKTLKSAYDQAIRQDGSVDRTKFNAELEKAKIPAEQRKMLLEFVKQ